MNMDEARPCSILAPSRYDYDDHCFQNRRKADPEYVVKPYRGSSTTPGPAFYRWRLSLRLAGHGGCYKPTRARFGQEKVSTLIPHRYVTPRIHASARQGTIFSQRLRADRKEAQAEVQRGSGTTCRNARPLPSLTVTVGLSPYIQSSGVA